MEVSKLTFSDEFKEKTKKKLSPQVVGKLRWNRLVEADKDGALQKATKRSDVAKIAGIMNYKNGYTWVASMIRQGVIKETITGYEHGRAVYEFHIGMPLEYRSGRRNSKAEAEAIKTSPRPAETKSPQKSPTTATISVNGVEIRIENMSATYLVDFVKLLTDK